MSSTPSAGVNPTELLRYVLHIDNLVSPERISEVRELLTGLGLVVDRIDEGEVEVAVSQSANPGSDGIRRTLEDAGFSVGAIMADPS